MDIISYQIVFNLNMCGRCFLASHRYRLYFYYKLIYLLPGFQKFTSQLFRYEWSIATGTIINYNIDADPFN